MPNDQWSATMAPEFSWLWSSALCWSEAFCSLCCAKEDHNYQHENRRLAKSLQDFEKKGLLIKSFQGDTKRVLQRVIQAKMTFPQIWKLVIKEFEDDDALITKIRKIIAKLP